MSESKKKNNVDEKGLETKETMKATGKKTGTIAKMTFQYDGKTHEKDQEVLGLDEKQIKELKTQGLV